MLMSSTLPSGIVSLNEIPVEPCPDSAFWQRVTEKLIAEVYKNKKYVMKNIMDNWGLTQSLTCLLSTVYEHYGII